MSMDNECGGALRLLAAPLQGYTDAVWRHCHASLYGGVDGYFTPFVRVEKGEARRHDMADVTSPLNAGVSVVPQVIFKSVDELSLLVRTLMAEGHRRIDLNMGCPFTPQVRKGRGARVLANVAVLEEVADLVCDTPDVEFSVKMRLGIDDPSQWLEAAEAINRMPLSHVAVHPRTVRQQYGGEVNREAMGRVVEVIRHPLYYNGDITAPDDIDEVMRRWPSLRGVMIGRGLLARPSLPQEWRCGEQWTAERRMQQMLRLHDAISDEYRRRYVQSGQYLSKIRTFWDYADDIVERKKLKSIRKAGSERAYTSAVALLR